MKSWRAEGAGNRFLVLDLRSEALRSVEGFARSPELAGALAQAECRRAELDGLLLLVAPARKQHAARFLVWNRDGTYAGACGNGLRCAARLLFDEQIARADGVPDEELTIEVESGTCRMRASEVPGRVPVEVTTEVTTEVTVEIGVPRLAPPRRIVLGVEEFTLFPVDVGNPHAVLFVRAAGTGVVSSPVWWRALARMTPAEFLASERIATRVRSTGAALQEHFPGGVNVGFCRVEARGLSLRVFERGVGETRSCGTGSTSAAAVARALGLATLPLAVRQPGGTLRVGPGEERRDQAVAGSGASLWLGGDVRLTSLAPFEQQRLGELVRRYASFEDETAQRVVY